MKTITKNSLEEQGYKLNPHYWLPGFYYCNVCKKYSLFYALSKQVNGTWHNIEICRDCECHEVEVIDSFLTLQEFTKRWNDK